jgi:hypothetical protein
MRGIKLVRYRRFSCHLVCSHIAWAALHIRMPQFLLTVSDGVCVDESVWEGHWTGFVALAHCINQTATPRPHVRCHTPHRTCTSARLQVRRQLPASSKGSVHLPSPLHRAILRVVRRNSAKRNLLHGVGTSCKPSALVNTADKLKWCQHNLAVPCHPELLCI